VIRVFCLLQLIAVEFDLVFHLSQFVAYCGRRSTSNIGCEVENDNQESKRPVYYVSGS
jgi:hypothetical protein